MKCLNVPTITRVSRRPASVLAPPSGVAMVTNQTTADFMTAWFHSSENLLIPRLFSPEDTDRDRLVREKFETHYG